MCSCYTKRKFTFISITPFNIIKENENLEKSKRLLNEDIKTYIMEAVKEQVHNETNSKVYYE